jgi:C4-type Zn-finger protein
MPSACAENGAQFMGFRDCPDCGETLFAAELAEFVCADRVVLHWRCDTCGHRFQTIAAWQKPPARAA